MSDRKFTPSPSLAVVLIITLTSWMIFVPLVNPIAIPLGNNTTGVISQASIENISPYTDYLKYLILLFTPPLLTLIVWKFGKISLGEYLHSVINITAKTLSQNWFLATVTGILLLAWVINIPFNQFPITSLLRDSFHEGEFLGFWPNFSQLEKPFINTVLIHGYGMDVLPTEIAMRLISNDNGIVLTRLFVNLQNALTAVGYFWILWEITGLVGLKKSKLPIFLLFCLFACIFDGIFFKFDGRRGTWFVFQLAITLRYFRLFIPWEKPEDLKSNHVRDNRHFHSRQAIILSLLVGLSIPGGFLYVYDRAIYFLAVYLITCIISLFLPSPIRKTWLTVTSTGVVVSFTAIAIFLGLDQVNAIASQIAYWGKYGRYISFIPLPPFQMTFISQKFWLSILIQAGVLTYLTWDLINHKFQLKPFVRKHLFTLILLSAAGVYMRITLDRSDLGHAYHGAMMTALLSVYLLLLAYRRYLENPLHQLTLTLPQKVSIGVLLIFILTSESGFNVLEASQKLSRLPAAISIPDAELLKPDYLEAKNVMSAEIANQSCFFNVTSEGLWYYLYNKPSCSKYSYVLYAKPTVAQNRVIEDLETTQPPIILLTNDGWFQNPWDEVLKADSASLIYQYILQQYRPHKFVQSHWFWRRSDMPPTFATTDQFNGAIDVIPESPIRVGQPSVLTGWGVIPETRKPADAVYLSVGENNQLIAVGEVNIPRWDVASVLGIREYAQSGWRLRIPTASLPSGEISLKVWAYNSENHQLTQIGEAIDIIKLSQDGART